MRTLICEFQPFHSYMVGESVEVELSELTYDSHFRGVGRGSVVRIPTRGTGRQSGSPGKHYHYAYIGDKNVKKGDWALVHNGSEFGIVEIKRVVPGIDTSVTKHVIEVLTQDEFKAYIERNKKIDELRSTFDELEYRLREHKKLDKYKKLAEEDPRAAELLKQVQEGLGFKFEPIAPPSSETTNA